MSLDFSSELEPTSLIDISAEMARTTAVSTSMNTPDRSLCFGTSLQSVSLLPDMDTSCTVDVNYNDHIDVSGDITLTSLLVDKSASASLVGVSIIQFDDDSTVAIESNDSLYEEGSECITNACDNTTTSNSNKEVESPFKQKKILGVNSGNTPMTPIARTDNSLCDISYNEDGSAIMDEEEEGKGNARPVRGIAFGTRGVNPGRLQDFVERSLRDSNDNNNNNDDGDGDDYSFLPPGMSKEVLDDESMDRLDFNASAYIKAMKKMSSQSSRDSRSSSSNSRQQTHTRQNRSAKGDGMYNTSFSPNNDPIYLQEVTDRFNSTYWRRRMQYRSMASVLNSLDFKIYALRKLVS